MRTTIKSSIFKKIRFLGFLTLTLISFQGYSQIDSLKLELEKADNDSVKLKMLTELAFAYEAEDFDVMNQYYNEA